MFIQTNISAMQSVRYYQMNYNSMSKVMEKLSTGLRINRAADDAARLAISQSMRFQINGYKQANRNILDGISFIQTAEGQLSSIQTIIQRMSVLANQASNGTYSDDDRSNMSTEFTNLSEEVKSIINNSKFNGIKLLDGSLSLDKSAGLQIQAGGSVDTRIKIDMPNLESILTSLDDLDITERDKAVESLEKFTPMLNTISSSAAKLGASQNILEHRMNYNSVAEINMSAAMSRIVDTDYAQMLSEFTQAKIRLDVSSAMIAQANSLPQMLIRLLETK